MAQPTTQLNATEQDTLVKQIGLALLRAAPRDWRRVTAQYRAVGRYHELTGEVLSEDGSVSEWMATHDIATLFGRLRAGMYREGRGTWFNARYQLDHPSSYNLEYDREEPRWNLQPPPQAYADELRTFPRSEENVPEWLMRRMSGLGPEQPGPRFRIARIFDGQGPDGRPVLNRPELDADELDRLYEYLSAAPVVLSERGLDLDRLAAPPTPKVPVAFHTDGVWIWPAAVNYYLQEYGIAPEGELVTHVQQTGFRLPEVPEQTLQAAGAHLTRGNQPPPRPPRAPEPVTLEQQAPEPEPVREEQPEEPSPAEVTTFTPMVDLDDGPPTMIQPSLQAPPESEPEPERTPEPQPESVASATRYVPPVAPPAPEPAVDSLRGKLKELGVPESAYRIGEPIQHGWSMEPIESGWRVAWYDEDLSNPAVFGDAEDAAAFMLGKLLLDPRGREAAPLPPAPPVQLDDTAPVNGGPSADRHREARAEAAAEAPARPDLPSRGEPQPGPRAGLPAPGEPEPELLTHGDVPSRPESPIRGEMPPRSELPPRQDMAAHSELPSRSDLPSRQDIASHSELPSRPDMPARQDMAAHSEMASRPEPSRQDMAAHSETPSRPDMPLRQDMPPHSETPSRPDMPARQDMPPHSESPSRPEMPAHADLPTRQEMPSRPDLTPRSEVPARSDLPSRSEMPSRQEPPARIEPPSPPAGEPRLDDTMLDAPPTMLAAPVPPPPPRRDPQQQPQQPRHEPARPAQQQNGTGSSQWPIQPLSGEPPLTLFRGKEMRELPAGSELDRFGNPNGNLTYAAGTPFEERSLVPEWVSRPYHVYRVQRPIEALAGVAIPWFNQPGGGAAYLLPTSIEELLAEGDLIELDPGEPPID
ncbi:TNT domain-containing protein [Amycolatopsis pithecellobii]|uniref:DUF4237 domain-containing protein n=1 Tax=Amycolatopsis pithecellobii TaxID=664692 RepID=A0A6N7Z381_9PSEU|nr:glycohydrolase toxin TNT-related protein [Amycolatopsis pithecellobii]MTD56313.1 DUF4237 domain-containing protein [Amycolatopsis pithecellobii]